jgi:hypothetical protein
MKDIYKKVGFLFLFLIAACDMDSDLENPNLITVNNADVNLVMNSVQLDFADFFASSQSLVNPLVRHEAMTGGFRYQTANTPQGADGVWSLAYEDVLVNADLVIKLAEPVNLTTHVAVAKILKAYTYLTLVDIFGDVPRTEALNGTLGNFNPKPDGGEATYDYAITLLTEARAELAKTGAAAGAALTRDIYYSGNRTRWNALANTLELKAQANLRMVSGRQAAADARITTLLAADIINEESENFTYKYGTATNPVSRHPLYRQYYQPIRGQAGGYISNYFMYELFQGKRDPVDPTIIVQDPRWRYYFYRQVGSIAAALAVDPKSLGCAPGAPPQHYIDQGVKMFCVFDPGFYGRDHGDGFGIPPDGPVITCAGVYPAGGRIDNTTVTNAGFFLPTAEGDGGNGAGIQPIWMSFYTDFLRAEIAARRGDNPTARVALLAGISNSVTQIRNFATRLNQVLTPGREPSVATYNAVVGGLFDAAANKLDVIGKEYHIATWGNGVEAYNSVRRNGAPVDLQPTLQLNPGPFYRSYVYPANHVNLNDNVQQKDFNSTNRVFWDTNTATIN